MRVTKKIILFVLVIAFIASCAPIQDKDAGVSYVTRTYEMLIATASIYNAAMNSVASLYSKGLLTRGEAEEAIRKGDKLWYIYHSAVNALSLYNEAKTAENKEEVEKAILVLSGAIGIFNEFIQPLLLKGVEK